MNASEKKSAARTVRCPRCNAQPYTSCKRNTGTKVVFLKAPHAERISKAIEQPRPQLGENHVSGTA